MHGHFRFTPWKPPEDEARSLPSASLNPKPYILKHRPMLVPNDSHPEPKP